MGKSSNGGLCITLLAPRKWKSTLPYRSNTTETKYYAATGMAKLKLWNCASEATLLAGMENGKTTLRNSQTGSGHATTHCSASPLWGRMLTTVLLVTVPHRKWPKSAANGEANCSASIKRHLCSHKIQQTFTTEWFLRQFCWKKTDRYHKFHSHNMRVLDVSQTLIFVRIK